MQFGGRPDIKEEGISVTQDYQHDDAPALADATDDVIAGLLWDSFKPLNKLQQKRFREHDAADLVSLTSHSAIVGFAHTIQNFTTNTHSNSISVNALIP